MAVQWISRFIRTITLGVSRVECLSVLLSDTAHVAWVPFTQQKAKVTLVVLQRKSRR